jgi:hypothetical protein
MMKRLPAVSVFSAFVALLTLACAYAQGVTQPFTIRASCAKAAHP